MISLRDYQRQSVDSVLSSKNRGITRPLASLTTGIGKTLVFITKGEASDLFRIKIKEKYGVVRRTS